jgi:hypothetical protein
MYRVLEHFWTMIVSSPCVSQVHKNIIQDGLSSQKMSHIFFYVVNKVLRIYLFQNLKDENAVSIYSFGLVYGVLRHFQQYFSYIVVVSFIDGRHRSKRRNPPICRKSLTNFITMLYRVHFAWAGFELATLVVIGIDWIGSCKSNYHMITATTAPVFIEFSEVEKN